MTLAFHATPFAPPPDRPPGGRAASARGPAPALRQAFLAHDAAREAVERLFAGALCVTTGQQPGLFTGPLYTLYKALSAAVAARRLQAALGRPVVPVFWVAGDDHDHAEAAHCHLLTASNEVRRLELPPRPPDAPLTPLYRERLDHAVGPLLDAVREDTNPTEFRDGVLDWLARHYRPEADHASAFAGAMAELLGRFGVPVFQPMHPAAKAAMAPLLLRALEEAGPLDMALAEEAGRLAAAGRPVPVTVGERATLVMLEGPAGRDRLVSDDGALHARRSGERFTPADLRAIADREPERLSPNVLLRPVVEAALLPTLAYVAGPGELAYLPQCGPIYARLGVAPQAAVPRWSGLAVEARIGKVMEKFGIGFDDLRLPEGQLEQRLVRGDMPPEAQAALDTLRRALPREFATLKDAATRVDPTLAKPVDSAQHTAETALRDLERRIIGHLKQQNQILVQQVAKARHNLFPLGQHQERVLSVAPYLVRYGPAFLDLAYREIDRWSAALEPAPGGP
ncbi:MAG TPA: bacillithiol biosynthesis cysteine-adding enzyme BshC [Gemmatimonadales bacterium]|nr:bacillithiol biosynthesis cysteine-adding enzyme BshC [Gemmatimonadales bacterium]